MACRSVAARCHVDLARVGPGIRDELGNRLRRERWVYRHNEGDRVDACDGCNVAEEVEIEFLVKRRIDRGRGADQEQGVSVRRRIHDQLRTNIAAGSWPVLDDKLLAETLRQPLADQTSADVGRSAGGKWDDDAHRPGRVGLRPSEARQGRQRGNPCCEMQELAAAQFHGLLLPDRLYWARVNGRGRAMEAWIDRKCDGLSGCPPKASTPAANQRGDFGTSRWAGSKVRLPQRRTARKWA